MKSFYKYYPQLGVKIPDENSLREKLKQSISNSRRRKYHGDCDNVNQLPELKEQSLEVINESFTPWSFVNEDGSFYDASNPCWEKACISKFDWVAILLKNSAVENRMTPQ